ncbi:tetratricopeptide repeat protein [Undibacterium sp. RuTC16W]|uniref:tetratricopeptide repeat protein n=1 Tax=Undibacterium sp. RuTC16W TaxID=3413048 RepID=UPI003BF07E75
MFNWLKKIFNESSPISQPPNIGASKSEHDVPNTLISAKDSEKQIASSLIDQGRLSESELHYRNALEYDKSDPSTYVALGFVLKEQGKNQEAEVQLGTALKLSPDDFDAEYLMASIASEGGRLSEAIQRYEKVLRLNPQFPFAYRELSFLLAQEDELEKAIAVIDSGLTHIPQNADFYLIRGNLLNRQNSSDEAILAYRKAISIRPDFFQAYIQLGQIFKRQKRVEDALETIDHAVRLNPGDLDALLIRGELLMTLDYVSEALDTYNTVLKIQPDCVDALIKSGILLQLEKRNSEALSYYQVALNKQPNLSIAWHNKSVIAFDSGNFQLALDDVERALKYDPSDVDTIVTYGLTLTSLERYVEAIKQFDLALQIQSGHLLANFYRGCAYQKLAKHEEALLDFTKAINIQPDFAKAHFEESLSRLVLGDLSVGWKKYEWRWQCSPFMEGKRYFSVPLWLGEQSLKSKTILLYGEQGLGDTINFVRYVKLVVNQGAVVLLEVQPSLKALLSSLPGVLEVYAQGEDLPDYDFHCPLPSLPCAFDTQLDTIPVENEYFNIHQIAPLAVAKWREKIGETPLKKVGLVWSGNKDHQNDKNRSIPFEKFSKILIDGINFFSLQKEVRSTDQAALDAHPSVANWGDSFTDFVDTAALIANLDLVVTVDTSVAHLAAAMGKPVWILIPFNPDWRWLLDRSDSPWYPTVTLFRQGADRDWAPVLDKVAAKLAL